MKQFSQNQSKKRMQYAFPFFQSSSVLLASLQNLAKNGSTERHVSFLTSMISHLIAGSPKIANGLYKQAVGMCYGAHCLDGLESFILTGINEAIISGNYADAFLGKDLLKLYGTSRKHSTRPIVFYDRKTSMISFLTVPEFMNLQQELNYTVLEKLAQQGFGATIRDLGNTTGVVIKNPSQVFDMAKCQVWVNRVEVGVSVITFALAPEASIGKKALGYVSAELAPALLKITFFARLGSSITIGNGLNLFTSGPICSGIQYVSNKVGSNSHDDLPKAGPRDIGITPGDFVFPEEPEDPIHVDPDPVKTSPEGTVEEGDGFSVISIGTTTTTMINDDGSSSTVTYDDKGNTVLVDQDADGNVTNIETIDDTAQPEQTNNYPNPDGGGNGNPVSVEGYPVPDGPDNGGPLSRALLVGYPNPDGVGVGGPAGHQLQAGRGVTFLLNIAPTYNNYGVNF